MDNHTSPHSEIQLNHGLITTIDAIDSDLGKHRWRAELMHNRYYAKRTGKENGRKKTLSLHRVIMERVIGRPLLKGELVDHEDNNSLNNLRTNLRLATHAQNNCNAKKRGNKVTSQYKGVDWSSSGENWRARITVNNKTLHLGVFGTPEDAYRAYCEAAKKYHGEFARYE